MLSVRQTTSFAADMPLFNVMKLISILGASARSKSATPAAAPVPSPRCMPAVRNGRLPSASSSKMLAGSSDLCAATIKCTDSGHNRTARSAAAHEITPSSTTGMRCAAAPSTDPQTRDIDRQPYAGVSQVIRVRFVKRQRRLVCDFSLQPDRCVDPLRVLQPAAASRAGERRR